MRDLISMRSGVPDYDTATPFPVPPKDAFRATVYKNPTKNYSPSDLLSVPWVHTGSLIDGFIPGTCARKFGNCYSSTNFVLLGLLLADHAGVDTWEQFDQTSLIPPAVLSADFKNFVSGFQLFHCSSVAFNFFIAAACAFFAYLSLITCAEFRQDRPTIGILWCAWIR